MQLIFDHQKHSKSSPFRRSPTKMEWVICAAFLVLVMSIVLIFALNPTRTDIRAEQISRVLPANAQIEPSLTDSTGRQWSWSLQSDVK